jgi:hypothetical protein
MRAWRARLEGLPPGELKKPRRPPNAASASEAVAELRTMLDRHLSSIDSLDQKATFVIPALGAVGALATPDKLNGLPGAAVVLLALAFSAAAFALLLALRVLAARRFAFGSDPVALALGTSDSPEAFSQGLANALAESITYARGAIDRKAYRLNLALFSTAVSTSCFVAAKILEG